jgi:hypothetical protein
MDRAKLFFARQEASGWQRRFRALLDAIRDRPANREARSRDAYLAQATDLADLERRMRKWERNRDLAY